MTDHQVNCSGRLGCGHFDYVNEISVVALPECGGHTDQLGESNAVGQFQYEVHLASQMKSVFLVDLNMITTLISYLESVFLAI